MMPCSRCAHPRSAHDNFAGKCLSVFRVVSADRGSRCGCHSYTTNQPTKKGTPPMDSMIKMTIRCDNTYSDGRESTQTHEVEVTYFGSTEEGDLEQLWEQLWEYTGDGTGVNDKYAHYEVTITACDEVPELVGLNNEWC